MSDNFGILHRESNESPGGAAIVPVPRCAVTVRTATLDDLPFIDRLQKMHTHMVGWFPKKQLEANIEAGNVLIAEEAEEVETRRAAEGHGDEEAVADPAFNSSRLQAPSLSAQNSPRKTQDSCLRTPLGYCIFKDQYMKRDDVGIFYQLNVLPLKQRNLIGATMVKEAFARAAYGCRLFCLWCAQDIQANWFWEALGFVPLAFRTGSRGKQRIHIFWERRIREGDESTPWWFPYQTQAGAVREDRIVLPIPPDTHWRDAKPLVLPEQEQAEDHRRDACGARTLPGGAPVKARPEQPRFTAAQRAAIRRAQSAHLKGVPVGKKAIVTGSGIRYVDRTDYVPELDDPDELREEATKQEKRKRSTKPRPKHDPKLVRQARELRDRYLEEVNDRGLLPAAWSSGGGKYDVSRALAGGFTTDPRKTQVAEGVRLLDAA